MKKKSIICCILVVLISINSGCTSQKDAPISNLKKVSYQEIKNEVVGKAEASNDLGIAYIKKAYQENSQVNQLFSPISLSFALVMLHNGAEDETLSGILQALGVDGTDLNESYQKLLGYYSNISKGLIFGNSLWLREDIDAQKDFTETLSTYYNAQLFREDFAKAETLSKMNTWISKQTNGMINEAVDEIDPMVIALLMNTVYFKGTWAQEFSEAATRPENFTPEHKEAYYVQMMQDTSERNYYEDDEVQVVKLNYLDHFSMTVILPKDDLESYMHQMDEMKLTTLLTENLQSQERVALRLPKTDYEIKNELNTFLKERGMELAFDEFEADFSSLARIEGQNVFISRVFQNARIIIDEKGTEAAAVTVIEVETTSAEAPRPAVEMICNRPYLYVIQEDLTGTILFIGYVVAP